MVALLACAASLTAQVGMAGAAAPGIDTSYGEGGFLQVNSQLPAGVYHGTSGTALAGPKGSALFVSSLSVCLNGWESARCEIPSAVRRFTPSGSLDDAYGRGGILELIDVGTPPPWPSMATFEDSVGRLLVAESKEGTLRVGRFTARGQIDTGFGDAGVVSLKGLGAVGKVEDILAAPRGRLIVSLAENVGSTARVTLIRLLEDGHLDRTYGRRGKAVIDVDSRSGVKGYVTPKGATLLVGQDCCSGASFTPVNRVSAKGKVDVGFNRRERKAQVTALAALAEPRVVSVVARHDGTLELFGGSQAELQPGPGFVLRLTAAGRAETRFGTGGMLRLGSGLTSAVTGSGGSTLVLFAIRPAGGQPQMHVERLLADGRPDPRFGGEVGVRIPAADIDGELLAFPDGGALVSYTGAGECRQSCNPVPYLSKLIEPSGSTGPGKGGSRR